MTQEAMKSSSLQPVKEPRLTVDSRDKFALSMCSMLGVPTLRFSLDSAQGASLLVYMCVYRCVSLRPRSTANPQFSGEGSGAAGPADGVTGGPADSSPV